MLSESDRDAVLALIEQAYRSRTPFPPPRRTFESMDIEDAYAIQARYVQRRIDAGARICGYKVGLTSKAMQEYAGTNEPDYGALLDYMILPEATVLRRADWIDPLIEIEVAFVMKERLAGPRVTVIDVLRATDFVVPVIELVDFRIERSAGLTVVDTVADLAAVGAVIVGANPRRLDDLDIRQVKGSLTRNGIVEREGVSDAVLGNPVTSVAWLANKLAEFEASFEPGHLILTGSFVSPIEVEAGDRVTARFDSGLGAVSVVFE